MPVALINGVRAFWAILFVVTALAFACGRNASDVFDRTPEPDPPGSNGRHHSDGFAAATVHGPHALFLTEDCRGCHGATLEGASAVSCDGCHSAGWRTNCTFCHGGTDNATGAPPKDITGGSETGQLIFRSHTAHVTASATHAAFDCTQCHTPRADILAEGHWFDSTPGVPEVSFALGLNVGGGFGASGSGTCTQSYCHGNGRGANGTYTHTQATPGCATCHAGQASNEAAWATMSGDHRKHLRESGVTCYDCHASSVDVTGNQIIAAALHVDGIKQNAFGTSDMVMNANKRCTGTCHGDTHSNESW